MNQKQIVNKLLYIAANIEDVSLLRSSLLNFVADLIKEGVTVEVTSQDRSFPLQIKENLLLRDHCTCTYCDRAGTFTEDPDGETWAVDHIIPFSRGGLTTESNAALSCWKCNSEKRDMTPTEYVRSLRFKRAIAPIADLLEEIESGEIALEIEGKSKPLLTGKPVSLREKLLVRDTYNRLGSINKTISALYGTPSNARKAWVKEIVIGEEGEVMQ